MSMLVTLADMKTFLGETTSTYDTFLNEQITEVSEVVENYCGRKFLQANYKQTFYRKDYPSPTKKLPLYHFPATAVTAIKEDDADITNYRLHKETGIILSDAYFMAPAEILEVTYTAGYAYADLPKSLQGAVKAIVQERYNKKKSGVPLNFGSDVQRVSIPGAISIDFDYTLSYNERKSAFGAVIGAQANVLDFFRSDRRIYGTGKLEFLEVVT